MGVSPVSSDNNRLRVFISWSGPRSKQIATALHAWIADVFYDIDVWMSEHDIEAGERWGNILSKELESTDFGILCLTPENIREPWLLFEAGSLAKRVTGSKVVPYCFGLAAKDIESPLNQFQGVNSDSHGTHKLMKSINVAKQQPLPPDRLQRSFDRWWPELQRQIKNLSASDDRQALSGQAQALSSTSFIDFFPANMTEISNFVKHTPNDLHILVDFAGYGSYSSPPEIKYLENLKEVSLRGKAITIIAYDNELAQRTLRKQFRPEDYGKEQGTARYRRFVKNHPEVKDYESFLAAQMAQERSDVEALCRAGIAVYLTKEEAPLFLWSHYRYHNAFFSVEHIGRLEDGFSFRTSERKMIDCLEAFFDERQASSTRVSASLARGSEREAQEDQWAGHWIFNTNEKYCPGAYQRMFERQVIAIYGYENGGANLEGASRGQKVFAYVNGQGIRAIGEITDSQVMKGEGIFIDENGVQQQKEYHLSVSWTSVLRANQALSNSEASAMGYSLPVRTVFGRLHRGHLAIQLESLVKRRANEQ